MKSEGQEHTTFNTQGVKQRDPSVLHDTVEAVEGESGMDISERVSCDEVSKSNCWGDGAASPPIATSSSDASSCMDAWGDKGEWGCGVLEVVCTGPMRYGVIACVHVMGVLSAFRSTLGFTADHWMLGSGVNSRARLFIWTGTGVLVMAAVTWLVWWAVLPVACLCPYLFAAQILAGRSLAPPSPTGGPSPRF